MKGIPNEQTRKIPRGGLTRRSKPSVKDQASDLVEQANRAAEHYDRSISFDESPAIAEKISDAFAYGYLLGQLRCRSKEIVGEAFAQRFQMSDENFAIDILGG